jgi:hypothetical protein
MATQREPIQPIRYPTPTKPPMDKIKKRPTKLPGFPPITREGNTTGLTATPISARGALGSLGGALGPVTNPSGGTGRSIGSTDFSNMGGSLGTVGKAPADTGTGSAYGSLGGAMGPVTRPPTGNLGTIPGIGGGKIIPIGGKLGGTTTPAGGTTTPGFPTLKPGEIATPEQIRQMAEAMYDPAYRQALDALNAQGANQTTRYDRGVEDYGTYVQDVLKDTESGINDSLLKRGMGRSSRAAYEVTSGLADVNANAQKDLEQMRQDYLDAMSGIDTQRGTLGATKEQNIQAEMLKLMQYYESIREFNAQQKLREKALKSGGGGGGGGKGGGGGGPTAEDIFKQETTLTDKIREETHGWGGSGYYSPGSPYYVAPDKKTTTSSSYTGVKNGKYYINGKVVPKSKYEASVG